MNSARLDLFDLVSFGEYPDLLGLVESCEYYAENSVGWEIFVDWFSCLYVK